MNIFGVLTMAGGLALFLYGMNVMGDSLAKLSGGKLEQILEKLTSKRIMAVLLGMAVTAVIQSSSASVGILQALCVTGAVNYATAIPIIMGQNIGTCVTALISSVGAKKNAKRASMIHLYFNMIGTVIFMVIFYSLNMFVHFEFLSTPANAAGIAVIHSLFNIGCVIILFPFSNLLVKLATLSIPDGKHEEVIQTGVAADLAALDERFLETPAVAMELCRNTAVKMAHLSQKALDKALDIINNYSDTAATYESSKGQTVSSATSKSTNPSLVAQLKADSDNRMQQLQSLVSKMFEKQGITIGTADDMWKVLASGNFTADADTIAKAKEDISEDGYWGVKQTSSRIFDFAMALAGDDEEKMTKMKEAFEKGFKEATKTWGKELPDISQNTRDAVLKKFDDYFAGKNS